MMKLSKSITVEFNWFKRTFMEFRYYVGGRKAMGMDYVDKCEWCGTPFEPGSILGLAQPKKGLNLLLCSKCIDELAAQNKQKKRRNVCWLMVSFIRYGGNLLKNKMNGSAANCKTLVVQWLVELRKPPSPELHWNRMAMILHFLNLRGKILVAVLMFSMAV